MAKKPRRSGDEGKKVKFLGRHLMVKGEYVKDILSGRKRATIRLGIVKLKHNELIVHGGGRPVAKIRVTNVRYKRVSELTDEDAAIDGFASKEELLEALRRAYGEVRPDDYVTIIEFEVVQRLDQLPVQDPYMGLEPADIARLALRYLQEEFNEEERRILLELTRTNSIRAVAFRLYRDLGKRWRVRRVLRRALRMLVERGYLRVKSVANQGELENG